MFSHLPAFFLFTHKVHKCLNLCTSDVLFQQLPVVVYKISYGIFSQNVITYLCLHETKLFCYVFLKDKHKKFSETFSLVE